MIIPAPGFLLTLGIIGIVIGISWAHYSGKKGWWVGLLKTRKHKKHKKHKKKMRKHKKRKRR